MITMLIGVGNILNKITRLVLVYICYPIRPQPVKLTSAPVPQAAATDFTSLGFLQILSCIFKTTDFL